MKGDNLLVVYVLCKVHTHGLVPTGFKDLKLLESSRFLKMACASFL